MTTMGDFCKARTRTGKPCENRAKHTHRTVFQEIRVCNVHLRALKKRERLGSDEELLVDWKKANEGGASALESR